MSAFPKPLHIRKVLLVDTTAAKWVAGLMKAGYMTRFCSGYAAVCTNDKTFTLAEFVEGDEIIATYQTCEDYMEACMAFVAYHQHQNS